MDHRGMIISTPSRVYLVFFLSILLLWLLDDTSFCWAQGKVDTDSDPRGGCGDAKRLELSQPVPVYTYNIVHAYPHDPQAFTQGLVFDEGFFYEGTGGYGKSSIRKVNQSTGAVLKLRNLSNEYFGEGVTVLGNDLIQVTWRSCRGFVYDKESFEIKRVFSYPTEGWGVTTDGVRIIMSDGTSILHFLDPKTFQITGHLSVADSNGPVTMLNELEYVDGTVYANIWGTPRIAVISPFTGLVEAWIDLQGLWKQVREEAEVDVLNGIAFDPGRKRLFVTGKLWPEVFEIELVRPSLATSRPKERFPHE